MHHAERRVCVEFFEALDACHANWWYRLTGGCNELKNSLNQCLRDERLARSAQNRAKAGKARQKFAETLKDISSDSDEASD